MLKSNPLEEKSGFGARLFEPQKIKRKINDGRRRRRSAPSSHPWRQYKLTQRATK